MNRLMPFGRILDIAHIDRTPGKANPVASSAPGAWAPSAAAWRGPMSTDRTIKVVGARGGNATIVTRGNLIAGEVRVTCDRFTDDGPTFVDGTLSAHMANRTSRFQFDVRVSGAHTGELKADLTVNVAAQPLPTMTGTFTARYDGHEAPPLPPLGPCYDKLPVAVPLRATITRTAAHDVVTVDADIAGDVRPVQNAVIHAPGGPYRTDASGQAELPLTAPGARSVTVTAGDTFVPVSVSK
jgi:hypothetical protein